MIRPSFMRGSVLLRVIVGAIPGQNKFCQMIGRGPGRVPYAGRMARQAESSAVPTTAAQRARYERVLHAGTAILTAGGEDALQMKELAQRASVSLDTLYRYFPSKEHV